MLKPKTHSLTRMGFFCPLLFGIIREAVHHFVMYLFVFNWGSAIALAIVDARKKLKLNIFTPGELKPPLNYL